MTAIHPFFVHFPMALFTVSGVFMIIYLLNRRLFFKELTLWVYLTGMIGLILAVVSGTIDEGRVHADEAYHQLMENHETYGYVFLWVQIMLFLWFFFRRSKFAKAEFMLFLILYLFSLGFLYYNAFIGGRLTHEFQILGNI